MSHRAKDFVLLETVGAPLDRARELAGEHLACRAGCFGCCIGPFGITTMDAERLQRGLATLPETEAERIVERSREAVAALSSLDYPGDPASGMLFASDQLFEPRFRSVPCPVLDLESGTCVLYEYRPIACRTYGPAIRLEGKTLPHCPLNYVGCSAEQIEEMRVDVEAGEAGREALEEYGGVEGETTVAWAVWKSKT